MAMVAAFIVGIVSGAVTMVYVLSTPVEVPLFTFGAQTGFLFWIAENSRYFTAIALALLMTFGLMSIIANVQDILRLQTRPEFKR